VNRHRVKGSTPVRPGDLIQLGAGGPEFIFDLESPDLKVTPVSAITAVEDLVEKAPEPLPSSEPAPSLVEAQSRPPEPKPPQRPRKPVRKSSQKKRIAGVVMLGLTAAAAAALLLDARRMPGLGSVQAATRAAIDGGRKLFRSSAAPSGAGAKPATTEAIVAIENTWRLVDKAGGRQLMQIYIPNRREPADAAPARLVPTAGANLPVFVLLPDKRLQPLLTLANDRAYQPIGGVRRGTGFVVTSDGLVLAGRACAAPWQATYNWPEGDTAAVVVTFDPQYRIARTAVIARRQFPRWIPVETDFVLENGFNQEGTAVNSRVRGNGVSDSLLVRFPALGRQSPGLAENTSGSMGLAAIRLQTPVPARTMPVAGKSELKAGDELTVAPEPETKVPAKLQAMLPGDTYELETEAASAAGAPVFDLLGSLVAVQTERDPVYPNRVAAVPIRRALQSIGLAVRVENP
jgi:hypothetical protein